MVGNATKSGAGKRRPRFAFLLGTAQRRLQAASQGAGEGKSQTRFGLLMALSADGEAVPMAQLGAVLDLGAPALSGLVDRMERDGLISKSPDPADGRAWNISLTEAGRKQRGEAVRVARQLNDRMCEGFNEDELEIVARWLEAIRTKFSKETRT